MALYPCPECRHQVSDSAAACPNCGAPNARRDEKAGWFFRLMLGLAVGFLVLMAVGQFTGHEPTATAESSAAHHSL